VPGDEEAVVACNGDILTDQPLHELVGFHTDQSGAATVMLAPLRSPYGIVDVDDDCKITSFREKPVLPFWINAGIYVLREFLLSCLKRATTRSRHSRNWQRKDVSDSRAG
jgi:NDP-sugar pyrophosphorylase family protein